MPNITTNHAITDTSLCNESWFPPWLTCFRISLWKSRQCHHLRNEETGDELCPAIVSGTVTEDGEITHNNFEISLVVFMPNITTNHAITDTSLCNESWFPPWLTCFRISLWKSRQCHHLRNEETGDELCPAIVSGTVTEDGNSPGSRCELTHPSFLLVS